MPGKNPLSQLASLGEEALGKLSQNPTTHRAIQSALQLRDRVDDLSKRVRGLEAMDKRLSAIEWRLDKLDKPSGSASKSSGSKSAASKLSGSKSAGSKSSGSSSKGSGPKS